MEESLEIKVKLLDNSVHSLSSNPSDTVLRFKDDIEKVVYFA